MPAKYANRGVVGGENISVPLSWANAPEGTKSFAVVMVDRHPVAGNWFHWLVADIPAEATSIPEGASATSQMPPGSRELNNTAGRPGYYGPQPPPGSGDHDYETTVYALSVDRLGVGSDAGLSGFLSAIDGKVLGSAKVSGMFGR